jgi:hypothetical protein
MGALQAQVLDDQAIPQVSMSDAPSGKSLRSGIEIAVDLDAGQGRRGLPSLNSVQASSQRPQPRIKRDPQRSSLCKPHNEKGPVVSMAIRVSQGGQAEQGGPSPDQGLPAGDRRSSPGLQPFMCRSLLQPVRFPSSSALNLKRGGGSPAPFSAVCPPKFRQTLSVWIAFCQLYIENSIPYGPLCQDEFSSDEFSSVVSGVKLHGTFPSVRTTFWQSAAVEFQEIGKFRRQDIYLLIFLVHTGRSFIETTGRSFILDNREVRVRHLEGSRP